jgi:hypothetical protein
VIDYFSQSGSFALRVEELRSAARVNTADLETLDTLSDVLTLIELMHSLSENDSADNLSETAKHLRSEIRKSLLRAASAASSPQAREHLNLRGAAFSNEDFEAARRFGATHQLPFELILGPVPVWRSKRRKTALSGVIAIPAQQYQVDLPEIDARVEALARELLLRSGTGTLDRSFEPPIYSICEILGAAGEAGRFPHHFANFLPEDEDIDGETYKTVVYANYYLQRFGSISLPLLRAAVPHHVTELPPAEVATVLLTWFRAHDLAHSYFDNLCRRAGLQENFVHIAREIVADLVGFLVVSQLVADADSTAPVLAAEAMRYARRDETLFADTRAARFELGALLHAASLPDLLKTGTFTSATEQLLRQFVGRLSNEESASFQRWIETNALAYQTLDDDVGLANDLVPIVRRPTPQASRAGSFSAASRCCHA